VLEEEATKEDGNNNTNVNDEVVPDSSDDQSDDDGRTPRVRRPPPYLRDYVTNNEGNDNHQLQNLAIAMFSSSEDPTTFEEAVKSKTWRNAMESEMKSIEDNNTWKLVDLPQGVKPIGVKWIFNKVQ
jgi:hypothetical protein